MCVCVCVCVCVLYRSYQVFSTTQSCGSPLHPQHECDTGSLCKSQGLHMCTLWPQLPTADHSGVSEWCTHSTLSATTNNQQGIIVYLSINNTTTIWATTYAPYPTHIKVCNLCSVKTTEKKGCTIGSHSIAPLRHIFANKKLTTISFFYSSI